MLKKALMLLVVLLSLPNLASAYNYWSITASTSPAAIPGAITPPQGASYSVSGSITNVVAAGVTSADFTVAAAPVGYLLSYVTIDGLKSDPVAPDTYRVSKGTKLTHTLSAVYATKKYTITTSKTGNGIIDPTVQVPAGSSKTINVTAAPGYQISAISAGDATRTSGDGISSGGYTFSNINADKSVSVTFTPVPTVSARIATSAQATVAGSALLIDGSTSSSSVPASYAWSVSPAGATITPTGNGSSASFLGNAAGTYTVKLQLSAPGATTSSATVAITVTTQALVDSNNCLICHLTKDPAVVAAYSGSRHAASTTACQACHTYNGDTMNLSQAPNVCAGCHVPSFGTGNQHAVTFAASRCITCHDPHSLAAAGGALPSGAHFNNITTGMYPASYVTSKADCSNCHANGANNQTIRQQWAGSGHAAITELPWIDYDFKTRAGCVQCHTTTGFIAFSTAKVTAAWGVASDKTKEVLTCVACHKNVATGEVRSVTPVKPYADEQGYQNRNVGTSNICMDCHSGRNNGLSIQAKVVAGSFSQTAFVAPHYLSAGGSLQAKSGYLFPGRAYLGYSSNSHRLIGMGDTMATGSTGPCVACHMTSASSHSYRPTALDQDGAITGITTALCVNCHRSGMPAQTLEANRLAFNNALEILKAQLAASGHPYSPDYPYFATKSWGAGQAGANLMGAAFNYKLFVAEPGAYAHNAAYAKQLIVDSIDAAANGGTVTGDITSALAALVASGAISQDQADSLASYKSAGNCASCHSNTTGSHTKHLADAIGCATCHNQTVTGNGELIKGGAHLNGANDVVFSGAGSYGAGTCSTVYCHSNGAGAYANPTWGSGSSSCLFCHPLASLRGAHAAHIGSTIQSGYGDTADYSTASEYRFGCGSCHPTDAASHRDGVVQVSLVPSADGSLKSKNSASVTVSGIGNTGSGITGASGSSVVCSAAYCHSNGGAGGALSFVASPDWYGAYAGDRCAMCHANAPATGAHGKHAVSIHTGQVAGADGLIFLGHGDSVPSTTISCDLCHSATVTNGANDQNAACASCHSDSPKGTPVLNKVAHLNGAVDLVFKDVKVVTRAQVRPASFEKYSGVWSRTSYKLDNTSFDTAKLSLNQAVFAGDKSCANVACHNGAKPKWSDRLTCVSCHSQL